MKDFISFRIHPFDIFYRFASIQTRNLRIFTCEYFKDSKGIAPNVFPNILVSIPHQNLKPHDQSAFQLKPGKMSI